jgi:hypothetical protein
MHRRVSGRLDGGEVNIAPHIINLLLVITGVLIAHALEATLLPVIVRWLAALL